MVWPRFRVWPRAKPGDQVAWPARSSVTGRVEPKPASTADTNTLRARITSDNIIRSWHLPRPLMLTIGPQLVLGATRFVTQLTVVDRGRRARTRLARAPTAALWKRSDGLRDLVSRKPVTGWRVVMVRPVELAGVN